MNLAELQRAFQAHLVGGDDAVVPLVEPAMRRGLPIYAFAYRATLHAALRDTFEKTVLWLGEAAFDNAANAYIDAFPSRSWTLSDYGDRFAAHLALIYADAPEVGEIGWLDWALRSAFSAGALPPVDPTQLAAVAWESARLTLAPYLAFRLMETNVIEVWNGLPDAPVKAVRLAAPHGLVVWRDTLTPQFRSAPPIEIDALALLAAGERFGPMCAVLADRHSGDAATIGGLLSGWLSDGLASVG